VCGTSGSLPRPSKTADGSDAWEARVTLKLQQMVDVVGVQPKQAVGIFL